ncbi:MAG: DUF2586 family protein [Bacteroidota bacterium]
MGSVKFTKAQNRLKRQLTGFDHYSGLVTYNAVLPAGFGANDRMKVIDDVAAAEALGITSNNADLGIKIMHYHISEFFRINPDGVFYLGIFDLPVGAHTFSEVATLINFAAGKLRQVGVWTSKAFVIGDVALLQTQYNDAFDLFVPAEIVYSPNLDGVTDANMPDLAALTSPNVHLSAGQDGGALGLTLYTAAANYSVGVIGAILGAISLAKVHENIGWVEKFNMAEDGGELDVPALSNGSLISALSSALTKDDGTFDTKRLIFLKKYPGFTGSYFNDSHGAVVASSDYAYIEDNRTIDKAIRGVYLSLLPHVNGPVQIDATSGKLSGDYVEFIQLEAGKVLEQMQKDGENSGYTATVDPNQDVNATGKITVNISNKKTGVSRDFDVTIGF